jgi:uncharacterized protein (DUF433 family)
MAGRIGDQARRLAAAGIRGAATYTRRVDAHPRIADRAREPRYTIPEAAAYSGIPVSTVRRWSLGHVRTYHGQRRRDEPLIQLDGSRYAVPLSFLNLLELRFLASYRRRVPLQAIRRALEYAGTALGEERPLLTVDFRTRGRSLFLKFAEEAGEDDAVLLDVSRGGQFSIDTASEKLWPSALDEFMRSVDYDDEQRAAFRWWPLGREKPVIINTLYNGGRPSTAVSGVRTRAIAVHRREGLRLAEIAYDVGATEDEVAAALTFEHAAA